MASLTERLIRRLRRSLPFSASKRELEVLAHQWAGREPEIPAFLVPDREATDADVALAERLLAAYRKATSVPDRSVTSPRDDVWSRISSLQAPYFQLLEQGKPRELAAYLCNMSRQEATHGIVQGRQEFERIRRDPRYRQFVALAIKDKLVLLAEAVGALPCENPELGPWGQSLHLSADVLVERISESLGLDIAPPDIDGGLLKIETKGGRFHDRDANALYAAFLVRRALAMPAGGDLCEIGAGVGRSAYWSYRLGARTYQIYDLPHINVLQGFYLVKSLPSVPVVLFGEELPADGTRHLRIFPNTGLNLKEAGAYDLVLNQDSFPEINQSAVETYLKWMRNASRRYFLSINHESRPLVAEGAGLQLNVPAVVRQTGGFTLEWRSPCWLRRGYVAELYRTR